MYMIIGIYLLIGVLVNLLIDIVFNHLEERQYVAIVEEDLERFDNFTKFIVMLFWPIVVVYLILSIIKEYTK